MGKSHTKPARGGVAGTTHPTRVAEHLTIVARNGHTLYASIPARHRAALGWKHGDSLICAVDGEYYVCRKFMPGAVLAAAPQPPRASGQKLLLEGENEG